MIASVLAVVALAARLPALWGAAPLPDEYMQFHAALAHPSLPAFLEAIRHNPHHLLVDPLSTWLFARLGSDPAWLRAPSLLWGLAAVEGLRRLGERGGAPKAGALAAGALALSGMHAEWSSRADFYAALSALSVWQTLLLLDVERDRKDFFGYAACAALFLHAHPYAVLVAAAHGLALLVPSKRGLLRAWAVSWATAGLLFLPWFLYSARFILGGGLSFWSGGLGAFLAGLPLHLGGASEARPAGGALMWTLGTGLCFAWLYSRALHRATAPALVAARVMTFCGVALVVLSDKAGGMYLAPRQTVWLLPFFLLEAADGLERLLAPFAASARRTAFAAVAVGLAVCRADVVRGELADGAQLKSVVDAVALACRPGDRLSFDLDRTAHEFLFSFDRAAFAAVPAFRDVEGATAACGGGTVLVAVGGAPKGDGVFEIRGTIADFSVSSPAGRSF